MRPFAGRFSPGEPNKKGDSPGHGSQKRTEKHYAQGHGSRERGRSHGGPIKMCMAPADSSRIPLPRFSFRKGEIRQSKKWGPKRPTKQINFVGQSKGMDPRRFPKLQGIVPSKSCILFPPCVSPEDLSKGNKGMAPTALRAQNNPDRGYGTHKVLCVAREEPLFVSGF